MNATVFGNGIERVAVREITPNIIWITHCLGDQVTDYYADIFLRTLRILKSISVTEL